MGVFDPEQQHTAGPVDDDHACRGPTERRGHPPIVTDGESSRTWESKGVPEGFQGAW